MTKENDLTTPAGVLPAATCSLFLGDCLEMMKLIPDGSVDMVMCDLPYGTTACKWLASERISSANVKGDSQPPTKD